MLLRAVLLIINAYGFIFDSMKYLSEITINKPIEEVIEKFDDADNIFKWMRGLQSVEHLEGSPGEVGAKMKMKFKNGKREIEMIETILAKDLPNEFATSYQAPGVYNEVRSSFEKVDDGSCVYRGDTMFQFKSPGMKFFAWIMPGMFRKQSEMIMKDFKNFVETDASVQGL
jgi:uncharacterized membrane protein